MSVVNAQVTAHLPSVEEREIRHSLEDQRYMRLSVDAALFFLIKGFSGRLLGLNEAVQRCLNLEPRWVFMAEICINPGLR